MISKITSDEVQIDLNELEALSDEIKFIWVIAQKYITMT